MKHTVTAVPAQPTWPPPHLWCVRSRKCVLGWACRLAPDAEHQGPSSWEGDSWALPWGQVATRSLPGWRQSVQREEGALGGSGAGRGGSWGSNCHWSSPGLSWVCWHMNGHVPSLICKRLMIFTAQSCFKYKIKVPDVE